MSAELQTHHLAKAAWEGWVYGRLRAESETLTDRFAHGVVSGTEGERMPGKRPDIPAELYWSIVGRPSDDGEIARLAWKLASAWDSAADKSYSTILRARAHEHLAKKYAHMRNLLERRLLDDKRASFQLAQARQEDH